jgi:hypothetical protein
MGGQEKCCGGGPLHAIDATLKTANEALKDVIGVAGVSAVAEYACGVARRMFSIASAPGWCARFAPEEPYEEERTVMLVSWALVEEDDATTSIVGVVQRQATEASPAGHLGLADEVDGFEGYTFTGLATKSFPSL